MTREEATPGASVVRVDGNGKARPGVYRIRSLMAKTCLVDMVLPGGAWGAQFVIRLGLLRLATEAEKR